MKATSVLVLLVLSLASTYNAYAAWETVITHTCDNDLYITPSAIPATIDTSAQVGFINKLISLIKKRVDCVCSIPDELSELEFERRFIPGIHTLLNLLRNEPVIENTDTCPLDKFNQWFTPKPEEGYLHVDLPDTFSLEKYQNGEAITMTIDVRFIMDARVHVAFKKCDNSYVPHFSISCTGSACNVMGKPCQSNLDCPGERMICWQPIEDLREFYGGIFNATRDIGMYEEDATYPEGEDECYNVEEIGDTLMDIIYKLFSTSSPPNWGGNLGFCTLDFENMEDLNSTFDDCDIVEEETECTDPSCGYDEREFIGCTDEGWCSPTCPMAQLNNSFCDGTCLSSSCDYDAGDCDGLYFVGPTERGPYSGNFDFTFLFGEEELPSVHFKNGSEPFDLELTGSSFSFLRINNLWRPPTENFTHTLITWETAANQLFFLNTGPQNIYDGVPNCNNGVSYQLEVVELNKTVLIHFDFSSCTPLAEIITETNFSCPEYLKPWDGMIDGVDQISNPPIGHITPEPRTLGTDLTNIPIYETTCKGTWTIFSQEVYGQSFYNKHQALFFDWVFKNIKRSQQCRFEDDPLTEEQLAANFIPWNPHFFFKLFSNETTAHLELPHGATSLFKILNESLAEEENGTEFSSFYLPETCNLEYWKNTKTCAFKYDGFTDLLNLDISINIRMKSCGGARTPALRFDCEGEGCGAIFRMKSCLSDSDCDLDGTTCKSLNDVSDDGNSTLLDEEDEIPDFIGAMLFAKKVDNPDNMCNTEAPEDEIPSGQECVEEERKKDDWAEIVSYLSQRPLLNSYEATFCLPDPSPVDEWSDSQGTTNGDVIVLNWDAWENADFTVFDPPPQTIAVEIPLSINNLGENETHLVIDLSDFTASSEVETIVKIPAAFLQSLPNGSMIHFQVVDIRDLSLISHNVVDPNENTPEQVYLSYSFWLDIKDPEGNTPVFDTTPLELSIDLSSHDDFDGLTAPSIQYFDLEDNLWHQVKDSCAEEHQHSVLEGTMLTVNMCHFTQFAIFDDAKSITGTETKTKTQDTNATGSSSETRDPDQTGDESSEEEEESVGVTLALNYRSWFLLILLTAITTIFLS